MTACPDDSANARAAADLQDRAHGWMIMWHRWRKVYSAWECRDPRQVRILEAPDLPALGHAMTLVEIELRQALPSFPHLNHREAPATAGPEGLPG
jgi:hypothetical protein